MSFPAYPAYKDSTISWLGRVPSHWNVLRLKHACEVFPSNVDKHARDDEPPVRLCNYTDVYYNERITADMPFMEATASEEQIARFTLRGGDTIITKDSETADDIAVAAYVPDDLPGVVCGYHLSMVRPRGSTCGAFVKRLFDSIYAKARFAVAANGLTRVGLGQYAVDNIDLPFPPVDEQRAIVAFLDRETAKIDALVEEQKRLIELLKEKRQAVISQAVTKGLDPSVPMKDSEVAWLGEVPESWKIAPLKRLCDLLKDGTHLPPPRVTDGVPLLSVRNIQSGVFSTLDDDSLISEESYQELCRSFVPQVGDVLLAIVGATLGKTALVPTGLGRFHIQRSLAIFRPAARLASGWLHLLFQSNGFQSLLWESVGFSAQPGIYLGTLAEVRVPVPPADLQASIVHSVSEAVRALDDLVVQAEAAVSLLTERRSALISAAVTGKIDVRGQAPH